MRDHVGGPLGIGVHAGEHDVVFTQWAASIQELEICPNMHVKLGGLGRPLTSIAFIRGRPHIATGRAAMVSATTRGRSYPLVALVAPAQANRGIRAVSGGSCHPRWG